MELLRGQDLPTFVREVDVLELGGQIVQRDLGFL